MDTFHRVPLSNDAQQVAESGDSEPTQVQHLHLDSGIGVLKHRLDLISAGEEEWQEARRMSTELLGEQEDLFLQGCLPTSAWRPELQRTARSSTDVPV